MYLLKWQPGSSQYSTRRSTARHATPSRLSRLLSQIAVPLLAIVASSTQATTDVIARVSVQPLSSVSITLLESAPATVISLNHARIASQLSGVLASIEVEVGERARTGDALATLECTDYQQNLARNEAQLDSLNARRKLADEQLSRALRLLPSGNISEEQVNQRRAEFDAAGAEINAQQAQIAISQRQVRLCRIESPFDGVVTSRPASLGDFVSPGTPIVEILDTEKLEVSSRIPVASVEQVDRHRLVFRTEAGEHAVRLRTLLPLVDEASRSREARFVFENRPALAGTPGRLVWVSQETALPANLLVARAEGLGVFVADDGHARFIAIPGALSGRPAPIALDPDTLIVTEGRHILEPGQRIEIVTD